MSPQARLRASLKLISQGKSQRLASVVCGLSRTAIRSTTRHKSPDIRAQVIELAYANPRYGYRRVAYLLPGVNKKAVYRIWREEGLSLHFRKLKKLKVANVPRNTPTRPNEAWAVDFCSQGLESGRTARILGIVDCFTRECLVLKAFRNIPASELVKELEWLFLVHGKPSELRSDNGPEYRSKSLAKCLNKQEVAHEFSQPGKPWQNGYIESFFGKLRDELLRYNSFPKGSDLQARLTDFQEHYNTRRPHSALGGQSPSTFIKSLKANIKESVTL